MAQDVTRMDSALKTAQAGISRQSKVPQRKLKARIHPRIFYGAVTVLLVYTLISIKEFDVADLVLGGLLGFLVLLPAYLWCAGRVQGLPIFPLHALPFF